MEDKSFVLKESFALKVINNEIKNEQLLSVIKKINEGVTQSVESIDSIDSVDSIKYDKMNLKEIESMISQERVELKELNKTKYELNSVNNNGIFILYWKPPPRIVSPGELNTWNRLINIANKRIKDFLESEKDIVGPKSDYSKIILQNIPELIKYKSKLMKKYKVKYDKQSYEIYKLISKS